MKKHYYNTIRTYSTIIIIKNKKLLKWVTQKINTFNYKLTFSNTLLEKVQKCVIHLTQNKYMGYASVKNP
jgi:HJR/Mrr/RecB family endonuclease